MPMDLEERLEYLKEELEKFNDMWMSDIKDIKELVKASCCKLKVGDKVFIHFTCKMHGKSINGIGLTEDMCFYNNKIATIVEKTPIGYKLDIDNAYWNYAGEWLIKVEE